MNDISLKSFVDEYGFVNYNKSYICIEKILKEKHNCDSMSLLKFYKSKGILKQVNGLGKIHQITINIMNLIK